jgi:hypothetical protein
MRFPTATHIYNTLASLSGALAEGLSEGWQRVAAYCARLMSSTPAATAQNCRVWLLGFNVCATALCTKNLFCAIIVVRFSNKVRDSLFENWVLKNHYYLNYVSRQPGWNLKCKVTIMLQIIIYYCVFILWAQQV